MSDASFDLHILILSEDSGGGGRPLRALTRSMLRLVDPSYREQRVDLEPESEEAQRATHGNLYQGHKKSAGHRNLVTIARAIARHIFDERGFVLFHVDADQAWKNRDRPGDNIRRFHDVVKLNVSRAVDDLLAANKSTLRNAEIMSRLYLVSPYWCIESWLYQNTDVAAGLCHKHHGGRDADRFEHWKQHREELDEEDKPKAQICLRDKHNHDLASQSFPARAVHEVGKSFHATVERLKSSPPLVAALAATHPGY
ncbi:MAG: hypothetical protein ABI134_13325 [Byssovorax sp.]